MRIFFPFLHHILIKDIFQHQCYYRKVLFIFLLPAYYLHYMNQWSRNVSYNFKHTCAHTQLMTFMTFVDPSSISCKNWLFLPPHKDISSYFSINIILVIFYHFAWVNFHQLIIRECGKRESVLFIFRITRFLPPHSFFVIYVWWIAEKGQMYSVPQIHFISIHNLHHHHLNPYLDVMRGWWKCIIFIK